MPKFKIEATRKMCMFVIVDAENLEEAERLYDQDLCADDYEEEDGGSWTLDSITEL